MGLAKFALGIAIACNHIAYTIALLQIALIDHIINQFGQADANPTNTPMVAGFQIVCPNTMIPVSEAVTSWIQ